MDEELINSAACDAHPIDPQAGAAAVEATAPHHPLGAIGAQQPEVPPVGAMSLESTVSYRQYGSRTRVVTDVSSEV